MNNYREDVDPMEVLAHARDTFLRYAKLHRAKGTDDGDDKACANAGMAEEMQSGIEALTAKIAGLEGEVEPVEALIDDWFNEPSDVTRRDLAETIVAHIRAALSPKDGQP